MRIIAFAYACGPNRGSEPGAGWGMARVLASMADVWVIASFEDRLGIDATLPTLPERDKLHIVHVDVPRWARWWKKDHRGIRLHYMLWQIAALRAARRLHATHRFDLAWHLTFSTVWLGSLLPRLDLAFIYGPVGGGVAVPWRLLSGLGLRGMFYESARALVNRLGRYLNPFARSAWRSASLILVQNDETRMWLPRRHRAKARTFHNVVLEEESSSASRPAANRAPTAVFAGRLLPLKGISLGLKAIAQTSDWRLIIYGRGSEETRLQDLAQRLRIQDRVEFRGWVPRDELFRAFRQDADLFLFPGLHEEGGWAVAEAVAAGLPVIYLDLGGPPLIVGGGGVAVAPRQRPADVVQALASGLEKGKEIPRPLESAAHSLTISSRARVLKGLLSDSGVSVLE